MKICLACSAGGHLTEILQLKKIYNDYNHFFVIPKRKDSESLSKHEKVYFVEDTGNRLKILKNFFQTSKILLKEKPDLIITTGAGSALSTCYLGKLSGKKIIFIESFTRVSTPSLFGKLVVPISDLVVVQWKSLLKYYKKAVYGGPIFNFEKTKDTHGKFIFVTVGSSQYNFDRLIKKIDQLIKNGSIEDKVIAQIGSCKYLPKYYEYSRFYSPIMMENIIRKSKIVITHAGAGSLITCMRLGKKTVVVPRLKKFGEIADDQQIKIAKKLEEIGNAVCVYDLENLSTALSKARRFRVKARNSKISQIIQDYLRGKFRDKN